ncbi:MAG: hypothetical protein K2P64_02900 [Lachnospiraceae bacterium]|nr:hypothetical protein [Lachnospiraceae bacterium]
MDEQNEEIKDPEVKVIPYDMGGLIVGKRTTEVNSGDIFMIPLFLPSNDDDYTLDYSKYKFHLNDIYAFGRLIEIQAGNVDLIEVFSYIGQIPENPDIIIQSGRMFAPEHIGHPFSKNGRWRTVFSNPYYDMWRDSDYENISFLSSVGHMWKGKETLKITKKQCIVLEEAGIPYWIMHSRTDMEVEIRLVLEEQGVELNYEQIVNERKSEFPRPRDVDKKLKEMIVPFRWMSEPGRYTLSLDAGLLNGDCFARNNMLGNGYDWEKVASMYIEQQGIEFGEKFYFDCEADTFSMTSPSKRILKEFAVSFRKLVMDTKAFEELLIQLSLKP